MAKSFYPDAHIGRRTGRQLNINIWDRPATINDYFVDLPEDSGDELSGIGESNHENRSNVHKSPAPQGDLYKSLRLYDSRRSHVLADQQQSSVEGDVHRSQAADDAGKSQTHGQGLGGTLKSQPPDDFHSRKQVEGDREKQNRLDRLTLDSIEVLADDFDVDQASHSAVLDQPGSASKFMRLTLNKATPHLTTGLDKGQNLTSSISKVYQMPSPCSVRKGVITSKRLVFDGGEESPNCTGTAISWHGVNPRETTALKSKDSSAAQKPSASTSRYLAIIEAEDEFCDDFEVFDGDMNAHHWLSQSQSKSRNNVKEQATSAKQNNVRNGGGNRSDVHNGEVKGNKSSNAGTRRADTAGPSALAGAVTAKASRKVADARVAAPSGEVKKALQKEPRPTKVSVAPASIVGKKKLSKSHATKATQAKVNHQHSHRTSNSVKLRLTASRLSETKSSRDKTKATTSNSSQAQRATVSHKAMDKSKLKSADKRRAELEQDDDSYDEEEEEGDDGLEEKGVQVDLVESSVAKKSSQSVAEDNGPVEAGQRFMEEHKVTDFWEEDDRGGNVGSKPLPPKKSVSRGRTNRQAKVASATKAAPRAEEAQPHVMRSRRLTKPPGEWWVVTDTEPAAAAAPAVPNRDGRREHSSQPTPHQKHPSRSRKKSSAACPPPPQPAPPWPPLSPSPARERSPSPRLPSPPPTKVAKSREPSRPAAKSGAFTPKSILKQGSRRGQKSRWDTVNFVLSPRKWHSRENQETVGDEGDRTLSSESPTPPPRSPRSPRKSAFGTSLAVPSLQDHCSALSNFSAIYTDTLTSVSKKDRSQQQQQSRLFSTPHSERKLPPEVPSKRQKSHAVNQAASVPGSPRRQTPQQPPRSSWHKPSGQHQQPEQMAADEDSSLQKTDESAEVHPSQSEREQIPWTSIQDSVKRALHRQGNSGAASKGRPEAPQRGKQKKSGTSSPYAEVHGERYNDASCDDQEPSNTTTVESNSTVGTSASESISMEEPAPSDKHKVYGKKPAYSEECLQDDSMEEIQYHHNKIMPPTNTPGMRRSMRTRVPPLKFWQGERINYQLRRSGGFLVSGIISPEQLDVPRAQMKNARGNIGGLKHPRAGPCSVSRGHNDNMPSSLSTTRSVNLSIQTEDVPEEMDLADLNEGTPVQGIDTNEEFLMDCVRTQDMCAYLGPHRQALRATDILGVWKALSQPTFGCGYFILRPLQEKGLQYVNVDTMIFNIVQGKLAVTIHNSNYILQTGDMFIVPPGNVYNVRNLRHDQASLFFTQLKGNETAPPSAPSSAGQQQQQQQQQQHHHHRTGHNKH